MKVYTVQGALEATKKKLRDTEAERDALASQVEASNKVLESLLKTPIGFGGSLQADGQFYYKVAESVFEKAKVALSKTPQQCLLDIQDEAGRKGFIAGYDAGHEYRFSGMGDELADEYAATVRQGGAE